MNKNKIDKLLNIEAVVSDHVIPQVQEILDSERTEVADLPESLDSTEYCMTMLDNCDNLKNMVELQQNFLEKLTNIINDNNPKIIRLV